MRIAQTRTPPGCLLALAAGWLILSFVIHKHPLFDYGFVAIMVAGAIVLVIYRKIYPDSFLIADALPQAGETFRGKIETPLKRELGEFRVRLELTRGSGKSTRTIWVDDHVAHAVHGEHGIVLPVQFSVPGSVQKDIDQNCKWTLKASARMWRAEFNVAGPNRSQNPAASA